jgi:PIN domain nuclease of toxin-antitoxin system
MQLLLDTHIALWAIVDDPRLPVMAKTLIADPNHHIWVSTVSIWEIAIKHRLARGDMPVGGEEALKYFKESGYKILPIQPEHATLTETLPAIHQDPFDRLLVAQALHEPMHLMTHDSQLVGYGDMIMNV